MMPTLCISAAALALFPAVAPAQAPKPPQQAQAQAPQPQPAQQQPQQQQGQQQPPMTWERMPRMQLEAEYAGPLKDTTVQRWRDPKGEAVCYLYVPFTAQHSPPTASGYVQYGPNSIGAISCVSARAAAVAAAPPKPAPAAKASPQRTEAPRTEAPRP